MSTTSKIKPIKLLLPGIFLLIVGIGNIYVGTIKGEQYQGVVDELILNHPAQQVIEETQLERLKASPQRAISSGMRRKKALARVDFYDLVAVGGKVFIILSVPFLVVGILLRGLEVYQMAIANRATATQAKEWRLQ